jgi:hypothetical protein
LGFVETLSQKQHNFTIVKEGTRGVCELDYKLLEILVQN